jgi:serine/threonine protein kinase
MNERAIFAEALDIADPGQRAAFLERACADRPELRRHIEELLAAQDDLGSFLARPPVLPPSPPAAAPGEGPGDRIGPYKLLQKIGEGGMGVVYMAEQEEPVRRKVALKIIKPGMDSRQVVARFEAERHALAMMDHPNIARVIDAGTTQPNPKSRHDNQPGVEGSEFDVRAPSIRAAGRPYFVMELVYGVPITRFCDEHRLTPRQRLRLFVPVCQAIQHAHQKGVIHRDVKPSNVLVTLYDGKPVPKVIDFGVAKAVDQPLTDRTMFTLFGAFVGTIEYMSPEQAEMNALGVDTRSDIYSLGALLYELLTGTTPLGRPQGAALDEVLRRIREEEPPRPSLRVGGTDALADVAAARGAEPARLAKLLRGELDWIVMKCLEKDRSRRYETASDLARDVDRYLHGEPVEAGPPSAGYRLRKYARRHWPAFATAASFVALLLAATAVSAWLAVRATRAEREASSARDAAALYRELLLLDPKLRGVPNDHPERATALIQLGKVLLQIGRPAEAEPILRECLAIRTRQQPEDWPAFNARALLGEALLGQQKYAEAEPLLVQAYEGLKRREAHVPRTTLAPLGEVLERIVRLYDEWGKPDEAAAWRKKFAGRRGDRPGPAPRRRGPPT